MPQSLAILMNLLSDLWESFRSTVRGFDSPRQLAMGITFGLIVGLLPKDSLLPYAIATIAILTPANLLCLILGIVAGSLISPHLDSISHSMGLYTLTYAPVESFLAKLYQWPLVPWTRCNNTVVVGSLELGLLGAIPIYVAARFCFAKLGPPVFRLVTRSSLARRFQRSPQPLQES